MIAYRAMLDVPRELVAKIACLLRGERRRRGTRRNSRALSCWKQALLGLVWFRKNDEMAALAAGFGISRATGYRYRDEVVTVLSAQAPDLHEALQRVADKGWSHVILDGKVFRTDRCADTTTSATGTTIHSWYSGKHRAFGGNVQAIMRPDGEPIWTSDVVAGHDHDLTAAREVDPGRPAGVSAGGFPRAASRTRRARFRATGAPQVPLCWCGPHPVTGHAAGMAAPR